MKKITVFLILTFWIQDAQSQLIPTIYPSNHLEIDMIGCNSADPLADETGIDAVWDYSDLLGCEENAWKFTFKDIIESEDSNSFPTANKYIEIEIDPATKKSIFNYVDENSWSLQGIKYNTEFFFCNNGEKIVEFSGSLNDSWTNDNEWVSSTGFVIGTSTYTIDGIGTLILPNATYQNVYRVHSIRSESTVFTEETYTYYSPEFQYHLFHMLVNDESQYQPNPVTTISSTSESIFSEEFQIFPNPTSRASQINIRSDIDEKVDIYLTNILGQTLFSAKDVQFAKNRFTINTGNDWDRGMHILSIVSEGKTQSQRIYIN